MQLVGGVRGWMMLDLDDSMVDQLRRLPEVRVLLSESLEKSELMDRPVGQLEEDDLAALYDAVLGVVANDSPVIAAHTAELSKGTFDLTIRGFRGAYFVDGIEGENFGFFATVEEATEYIQREFGEFLIDSESEY